MSANAAAVQAELMEKEKHILEQQNRVEALKSKLVALASHQKALDMERRRCVITQQELTTVPSDRPVYKSLGRVFVRSTVEKVNSDHETRREMCQGESAKISEETRRLGEKVQSEEQHLQQMVNEFMAQLRLMQASPAAGATA
jgi:chaperonin cofactor prefoldin